MASQQSKWHVSYSSHSHCMRTLTLRDFRPFGRIWWDETVSTVTTRAEPHVQAVTLIIFINLVSAMLLLHLWFALSSRLSYILNKTEYSQSEKMRGYKASLIATNFMGLLRRGMLMSFFQSFNCRWWMRFLCICFISRHYYKSTNCIYTWFACINPGIYK